MNWYVAARPLIKVAGPKEKIQQYKVVDPILQLFIMKFDSMIKWGGYSIENEETGQDVAKKIDPKNGEKDIQEFIQLMVLPKLFAKMDPENPDNYLAKKFDVEKEYEFAKRNNIFNPELEHAHLMHINNPEGAEKFYLNVINRQKQQTYDGWKQYLIDNPDYAANPAFIYMLLNPVVETSSAKTVNPPPAANPAVIGQMFQKLKRVRFKYDGPIKDEAAFKKILALNKEGKTAEQISAETGVPVDQVQGAIEQNGSSKIDIIKDYQKDLVDHSIEAGRKEFSKDNQSGWLKLPMKANTKPGVDDKGNPLTAEQVYDRNLDILHNFSVPNSWCTKKNSNGPIYLSDGDFWILVDNGKAHVGIRFGNQNQQIYEIAGDQSFADGVSRSCPTAYWREITDLIYREGLEPKITGSAKSHWDRILKERNLNKSFFNEDGTPNFEELEWFKNELERSPELYNRVTENENFAKYPAVVKSMQDACKKGWFRRVEALGGHDAFALAENLANNAQQMPDFVLNDPAFADNVHGRLAVMYQNAPENVGQVLDRVPNHWQVFPRGKEIFKEAVLAKYRDGIHWVAGAHGATRKTKEERRKINIANMQLEKMQEAIGKYLPELNEDRAFEIDREQAKLESAGAAIEAGFFSQDMPRQSVEAFFQNPQNIEKISEEYAKRISGAHKLPYKRQTEDTIFMNEFMDRELNAIAPGWVRKLPSFQQLVATTKRKVLNMNIGKFVKFDEEYRNDPDLFNAYKAHVLKSDPLKRQLLDGQGYFDPRLQQDPDFRRAVDNAQENIPQIVKTINLKPAVYLSLNPDQQQQPEILDAYLRKRVNTNAAISYSLLGKEYPKLPAFVKAREDVKEKYINVVIMLLTSALPGSSGYLKCEEIDPVAMADARVVDLCNRRAAKQGKQASLGWYRKLGVFG